MVIRRIQIAPPNKVTTKMLLRNANKPTSYLEVEEDIKDVKDLYFEITQFMDNIGNMDDAFPVCYGYERKLGYVMKVSEGCAIKWDGIIYCEGDVLGVVKDKEMI